MRRILITVLGAVLAAPPAHAGLRIVAATNDLGAIARAVAGPEAEIEVVARPDRDPHALQVLPSFLRLTARADVYLEVGLGLDLWSAEIVRGSRNRKLVHLRCSDAVEPMEVPVGRVDASQGDVHPDGNPHYWLDPENGARIAYFLAERLGRMNPGRTDDYVERASAFTAEIEGRLPAWTAALRDRSFVEFHRTWVYLAERMEVRIAGQVEPLPGIPPSGRHLAELAGVIRRESVPVIVRDTYHAESPVEFLVRETGVRAVVLPSSCAVPTPEAYLALFDDVAAAIGRRP